MKYLYNSHQQLFLRIFFYIPALLLFLAVIPGFSIYFLKKNKKRLYDDANFKMKFGFIYQEYRKNCYYIEFIKVGIKLFIMIIQSVYKDTLQLQVSIIQQILTFYLVLVIRVRPYSQHSANTLEIYNISLSLLNMIISNSIHWSHNKGHNKTTMIFIVILLILNFMFISLIIYFFFRQQITFVNEIIVAIKHKLVVKFPRLRRVKAFKSVIVNNLKTKPIWQKILRKLKDIKFRFDDKICNDPRCNVPIC